MNIKEAIERADALQNNNFSKEVKTQWLGELEEKIMNEQFATHETLNEYEMRDWILYIRNMFLPLYTDNEKTKESLEWDIDEETELLAPLEYHGMYTNYLLSKFAFYSGEYERHNIFENKFLTEYQEFCNYINRTYKPLQNNKIEVS